jgi:outer membrane protein assembly factor BamB
VTDGKHIYVDYGSRGIYCLDMEGNIVWRQSLGKMRTRNSFGEGASAALAGDRLIVPWDHEGESFVAALDTANGEVVWKTERNEATSWGTPLIVERKGRTQVIVNGTTVRSYDLADGKLIWECGGQTGNPIPTPMLYGDYVICMTGFRGDAVYCISLDSEGDVTSTSKVAWKYNAAGPYVPTGVLYRDQVYLNKSNTNVVAVLDAKTGKEVVKPQRLGGLGDLYSSPVAANEHVYYTDRNGTTVVIKHGDSLDVVSRNSLDETIDSSLAIVGDRIFIRGEKHLFCVGEK